MLLKLCFDLLSHRKRPMGLQMASAGRLIGRDM